MLRGDDLDVELLAADAARNFELYGFYGLSVWVPGDGVTVDAVLATKLVKSRLAVRFRAGDLYDLGLALWDTGQFPHYDGVYLAGDTLEGLVSAFVAAPRTVTINDHYDPDGGPDR